MIKVIEKKEQKDLRTTIILLLALATCLLCASIPVRAQESARTQPKEYVEKDCYAIYQNTPKEVEITNHEGTTMRILSNAITQLEILTEGNLCRSVNSGAFGAADASILSSIRDNTIIGEAGLCRSRRGEDGIYDVHCKVRFAKRTTQGGGTTSTKADEQNEHTGSTTIEQGSNSEFSTTVADQNANNNVQQNY